MMANFDAAQTWKQIPYFNKRIVIVSTIIYLTSFFTPYLNILLINIPYITVGHFQIHRILTTVLVNINILQLLFGILSLIPQTSEIERSRGSVYFFFEFIFYTFIIQTLFCLSTFLLSYQFGPQVMYHPSMGLWSLVLLYITIMCYKNPEQQRPFLCFPVLIKSKYYPLLILVLFCFMQFQMDLVIAYLTGIVAFKKPFDLSATRITSLQSNCLFKCLINSDGFIKLENANSGFSIQAPSNQPQLPVQTSLPMPGKVDKPFQGKGVQIGDAKQQQKKTQDEYQSLDTTQ